MQSEVDSKLPEVGTTIFTVMSRLAAEHGAIDLSQGFPDFEPAEALLDLVGHYLKSGKNQYAPMIGVPELRRAIAAKLEIASDVQVDAETEITVTSGATEALFCAIHALVRPRDEVIMFDPAYDSYAPAVSLAGGKTIRLALTLPHYRIDWAALEAALNPRTRLVIINSPHNPTATILTRDDLDRLAQLLQPHDAYLLSDEVYEHIIFDGERHASVLAHPQLAARSFAVFSFGKTYHATGWKIGYCVAPPGLTAEFRKIHQFNTFTTVAPMQWALADFVRQQPGEYAGLSSFYQQKRDLFGALLADSRFRLLPSRGTYFQLADYRALRSDASDLDDMAFARHLTVEKGVAVIPLSPFYQAGQAPTNARIVRFCFAKQDQTLRQAAGVLCGV